MKTGKRHIKNGKEFNRFFPIPKGENIVIKRVAQLEDTINLMKDVVGTTLEDTVDIAQLLEASTEYETCKNIWDFCFNHLQYTKDDLGKEQVRRPSRTWKDRIKGIDCDCISVFIGSILTNLNIPFSFRLTKYSAQEFEHVYPIAHTNNGVIILDAVVHSFNREVKYSAKQDIKMELQYLNGFDENDEHDYGEVDDIIDNEYPMDAQAILLHDTDLEGLEGRAERRAKRASRKAKRKEKFQNFKKLSLKEKLKKGLHVVNRFNPATGLLRLGILASMKLNVMKVASKIRFAYWSSSEAQRNNMDLSKYNQLTRIREKLEKIFYGAGGKTSNLKKAILTGKGNRDRRISLNGLGFISTPISDDDDLRTILGDDIYFDESEGIENGINGLGSVAATGAAVASATGVLASIAALIKKLGSLFKKNSPQAQQEMIQENTENQEESTRKFSMKNLVNNVRSAGALLPKNSSPQTRTNVEEQELTVSDEFLDPSITTKSDQGDEQKGFMAWIKQNPMLAGGIALALVGGAVLIYKNSKKKGKSLSGLPALAGTRKRKRVRKVKRKNASRSRTYSKRKTQKRRTSKPRRAVKRHVKKRAIRSRANQVKVIELL